MRDFQSRVIEEQLDSAGQRQAWLSCPDDLPYTPGQYFWAWAVEDLSAPLATAFFPVRVTPGRMLVAPALAAPGLPDTWTPGAALRVHGPAGHGFQLSGEIRRLALVALDGSLSRLLPLAYQTARVGADIALFADGPLPPLPLVWEANPLSALNDGLVWADFLAVDIPLDLLSELRERLHLSPGVGLPCLGQVLVRAAMPCVGIAACGACAVPVRRKWPLVCEDGPVFNLEDLDF